MNLISFLDRVLSLKSCESLQYNLVVSDKGQYNPVACNIVSTGVGDNFGFPL